MPRRLWGRTGTPLLFSLLLFFFSSCHWLLLLVHSTSEDRDEVEISGDGRVLPLSQYEYESASLPAVIWMAPFLSGGGYCTEALSFLSSLYPILQTRLAAQQHGDAYNQQFVHGLNKDTQQMLQRLFHTSVSPSSAVVICHSEPGAWHPALFKTSRCPPSNSALIVGRTMFETDRVPDGWKERLNKMDYIWVPTHHQQKIFVAGGVDEQKLRVIPEPVDVSVYTPVNTIPMEYVSGEQQRWLQGYEVKPFRFLSIFKWEERKGWPFLLSAYLSEFHASPLPVELWILTSAYHSDAGFQEQIQTFIESHNWGTDALRSDLFPPVHLLPSGVPSAMMPSLYKGADCFVLPSRGEGWGRPHVEAMSMGLPVIATRWSGPSEYMTENNSFPLEHEGFDTIGKGAFKGHKWARPSVEHLRALMRLVVVDPAGARERGMQARQDMVEKYCPACVAHKVLQELQQLQQQIQYKQSKPTP